LEQFGPWGNGPWRISKEVAIVRVKCPNREVAYGDIRMVSLPVASVAGEAEKELEKISTWLLAAGTPLAKFTVTCTVPRPIRVRLAVDVWSCNTPT